MKSLKLTIILLCLTNFSFSKDIKKCKANRKAYDCKKIETAKRTGFCSKNKKLSLKQITKRCNKEKIKHKG